MSYLNKRSRELELLDSSEISFADIKRNMFELNLINHYLGGHQITKDGLNNLLNTKKVHGTISIVEVGCGGGDNLRVLKEWAIKRKINVQLTGIDINAECIQYAKSVPCNNLISFIHSDYRDVQFNHRPDIIFSSLFTHHFYDQELIGLVKWMQQNSNLGFFINDLHRHPIAYYSIKAISSLFSKSYLVKNDAPLSVLRGFKRKDWQVIMNNAGIYNFNCEWKWAFRWLVTYINNGQSSNRI